MPKMIYICILLIYFKVISKKGGHYCPRLPYMSHPNIKFFQSGCWDLHFFIFKVNTLCTFLFPSILYTNRLLVYPSAREAPAKKINISCV